MDPLERIREMKADKRMETIRVLMMMKDNEDYCEKIGLRNISHYTKSNELKKYRETNNTRR